MPFWLGWFCLGEREREREIVRAQRAMALKEVIICGARWARRFMNWSGCVDAVVDSLFVICYL